jgi:hypothetical protein
MNQAAGCPPVFDRKLARGAWDLDRMPGSASPLVYASDFDGLLRALSLALPVSALLWLGTVALVANLIRG